ncbi:MAG: Ig-like domain-containing protein [Gammaproteobacteria bacterium]|nr:Ig-like domain-containing protein [Gammaproteobacteria bacterium]
MMERSFLNLLLVSLLALSLAACDVQTYDDAVASIQTNTPPPPPPPPPPGASFGAVFSEIQAGLFTPTCASSTCHGGGNPAAGLNLEAASSHANLVGIASTQDAGIQRVNAGDPDNSYLIQKLEGTAATGQDMPPSGAILQADIDMVRQWISAGAVDDTIVVLNPIQVTSLTPAPNADLPSQPAQIIAGFSRDVDASTVNALTFTVFAAGGDGNFNSGNEVQITAANISVPGGNPASAVFDLTGVTLADDRYRVTLHGTGANVIMDLDANALDGEFTSFPSGDGTAGGDFIVDFTITTPVVPPIRVVSLNPAPNSNLTAQPTQIIAGFSRDLDPSTVDALTFTLFRSGGDGNFNSGNEVQITAANVSVPGANPATAVFDLTGVTLADDTYRVTLYGDGANVIRDLDGNALDGEFSNFPSGNGIAGGDFLSQFTITTPVVLGPTLDQIQAVIFAPRCASCHAGAGSISGIANMDLRNADAAFNTLVNVTSAQDGNFVRVVPTQPDDSYLVHKVEGVATVGGIMPPPPAAPLSAAEIAAIRQWITDGALR